MIYNIISTTLLVLWHIAVVVAFRDLFCNEEPVLFLPFVLGSFVLLSLLKSNRSTAIVRGFFFYWVACGMLLFIVVGLLTGFFLVIPPHNLEGIFQ